MTKKANNWIFQMLYEVVIVACIQYWYEKDDVEEGHDVFQEHNIIQTSQD